LCIYTNIRIDSKAVVILKIKTLIGTSGSWKDLLPGESTVGCAVFEIPEDEEPVEASLAYVDHIIVLDPKP